MITWMILAASVASAQDCQPVSAERVSSTIQQALLDFATLDEDSFDAAAQQAFDELPCLDEVLLSPNAAAFHRLMGLRAFFAGQDEAAVMSFRASLNIEPDYELSSKIAPKGGKLHRLWLESQDGPSPYVGLFRTPGGMYAWVDGAEGALQAEDLPSIVQYGITEDSVSWTGYLQPGELPPTTMPGVGLTITQAPAVPDAAPVPEIVSADGPTARRDLVDAAPPEKTKSGGRGGLIAATVVSGVMAGGLYGGASYMRGEYDRFPTRENFLVTNGAFYGALGMGAATVTFGSLAVLTSSGR